MKELSIEEKAQRYDKAIKRANELNYVSDKDSLQRKTVEHIFPELKESEDERIRQFLIHEVTQTSDKIMSYRNMDKKDVLAWLEKQGEQDNNEDSNILQRFSFYSYKDEPNILYLAGLYVNKKYRNKGIGTKILEVADEVAKSLNCHAIRLKTKKDSNAERLYRTHGYNNLATEEKDEIWLEKQGQPTDINPSEFDTRLQTLIGKFDSLPKEELIGSLSFWLNVVQNDGTYKSTEKQGEQKPDWSEEDERIYQSIMDDTVQENQLDSKQIDWLKSLKCRVQPQPKQEWSEDDETNASYIVAALDCYYRLREERNNTNGQENLDKARNWLYNKLKFLRPQINVTDKELTEQKHAGWSDYDECMLTNLIDDQHCSIDSEYIHWLKSLKERYIWKPSDEQMRVLDEVIRNPHLSTTEYSGLIGLMEQLKKLRKE